MTAASQGPAERVLAQRTRRDSVWARLLRSRASVTGLVLVLVFILLALLAPVFSALTGNSPLSYNSDLLGPDTAPAGPFGGISTQHWFGVEPRTGRDLFAIVSYGAQVSLLIGLAATLVSIVVGVIVGLVAGFYGGFADRLLSRLTDVIFGFPFLIFAIALSATVPASVPRTLLLILVIGFFGWPSIARVVRSETLSLKERGFVRAAAAQGTGSARIIIREIFPNILATIIVFTTVSIPGKIGAEAALSFLGVGVNPPTPSWGRSISDAISWVQVDPMYLIFPGMALFLVTLGFNMFGDGLRDALDPAEARSESAAPIEPVSTGGQP
ncbi:MAG TPA: ABC transporter permease [Brevibacterium sp.]|uniref:Peptide/nickel transport system permease protein n=3 Tax=Brevibacterium TaxID=1696 RepID=A0A2H1JBY5_9MICO|nr:peptide/nickel transport system permease protein [Brevibacterium antiquum]SMX85006.1 peptide/nickel transport system permease protein [Brevibacterium antiquum CNRZ 918]HCG54788.1 ABC transporter permease [Brevibacterium sp.]